MTAGERWEGSAPALTCTEQEPRCAWAGGMQLDHKAGAIPSVLSSQQGRGSSGWGKPLDVCDYQGTGNGAGIGPALGTAPCGFSALTREQGVIFKILLSLILE